MYNNDYIKSCYLWLFISLYDTKFDKESMNDFFSATLQLDGLEKLHPNKKKKKTTFPPLDENQEKYIKYKIADFYLQGIDENKPEYQISKSILTKDMFRSMKKLGDEVPFDLTLKQNLKNKDIMFKVISLLGDEKVIEIQELENKKEAIFNMENLKEFKKSIKAHL